MLLITSYFGWQYYNILKLNIYINWLLLLFYKLNMDIFNLWQMWYWENKNEMICDDNENDVTNEL